VKEPIDSAKELSRLQHEVNLCQIVLGYEDGTLLENIKRFTIWAGNEIEAHRRGNERLLAYCEALQKQIAEDVAHRIAKEVLARVRSPFDVQREPLDAKEIVREAIDSARNRPS
jgi:hypothetical protein